MSNTYFLTNIEYGLKNLHPTFALYFMGHAEVFIENIVFATLLKTNKKVSHMSPIFSDRMYI